MNRAHDSNYGLAGQSDQLFMQTVAKRLQNLIDILLSLNFSDTIPKSV
jgi:hypothetical protein